MTTFGWKDVTFESWLASLHGRTTTPAARAVLSVLMQQPERASHASTSVVAEAAGVNIASVTRAAQALGFDGWPALREELRTRYLSSLSNPDAATPRRDPGASGALERSLETDLRTATTAARRATRSRIMPAVQDFAAASTRLALGAGTYEPVAELLATIATLGGYHTDAPREGASLVNRVARLGSDDMIFAIGFWRHHESTIIAIEGARSRGAKVCVMTDRETSPLTESADHVVLVSAEGSSYFPSLTSAVAVVNAFCAELATLDAARTRDSLRLAEVEWSRSGLLRHPSRG